MFDPAGTLTGGAAEKGSGVLGQLSELRAARAELAAVEKELASVAAQLASVRALSALLLANRPGQGGCHKACSAAGGAKSEGARG